MINSSKIKIVRYPGGKQRILGDILLHLPPRDSVRGRFIEPFVGGGAVFFAFNPFHALLADINNELIELYRGLRRYPEEVWRAFCRFPNTKDGYYRVRDMDIRGLGLEKRAARTLYLNRTCFKGMWRHNANGKFNVGYGGQDRRWVISKADVLAVSKHLRKAKLKTSDFEAVIDEACDKDFLFLDPPYRPGAREMTNDHYVYSRFTYDEHKRLARALERATRKGVRWAMTTSGHRDIVSLFEGVRKIALPRGTGRSPGLITRRSGEVLICNYDEETR